MPGDSAVDTVVDPSRRRLSAAAGLGLLGVGGLGACAVRSPATVEAAMSAVPPFSDAVAGGPLPAGWHPYLLRPDRIKTVYSIARRDGRNTLHAVADSASSGLSVQVDIDPQLRPWLRWSWRVDTVHEEASVAEDITEDTPARIVVAFAGDLEELSLRDRMFYEQVELFTGNVLPYATLTYVWDGRLPVGSVMPYVHSKRIQFDVVESGASRAGRWLHYERNLVEDYRRVFGAPPRGHVTSVGVLTDSDDLKNHAEAWYGDIGLFAESAGAG